MDGGMDGQTDGRMFRFPVILQDFAPSSSLWGRCPAYLIAITKEGKGTDDIFCLWVTGFVIGNSSQMDVEAEMA